jgi:hypothetical protein
MTKYSRWLTMRSPLSLRIRSRLAGLVFLLATVALYAFQRVVGGIRVDVSVGTTAANSLGYQPAFAWAFAINLVSVVLVVAAVTLLDEILRPMRRRLSRLAVLLAFVGSVMQAFLCVLLYAVRTLVDRIPYGDAFYARQVEALSHLFLAMIVIGWFVAVLFFALYVLVVADITTELLPPKVATTVLVGIIVASGIPALFPALVAGANPFVLGLMGLFTLSLFLLVAGVNEERWEAACFMERSVG